MISSTFFARTAPTAVEKESVSPMNGRSKSGKASTLALQIADLRSLKAARDVSVQMNLSFGEVRLCREEDMFAKYLIKGPW